MAAAPAYAAISVQLAANYDSTRTTSYPNGDKPDSGCVPPTGYTEVNIGDGGGEICEVSSTQFDLSVSGTRQSDNNHLAHKDCGGSDCQVIARITNTYAGSAEASASVGIGIRETATQASWLFQVHSLQSGATALQTTYGASTYTSVNGGAGQSRPRYVCLTYDVSTGDIKSHASDDGSTWTEIASTNRALSDDEVYIFGASKSATETLQATIDNIAVGSTINCYTPGGGGGGGPTLAAQIDNQSLAQGTPFSLDISGNFTGETSFEEVTLPSGSGLAFSPFTGIISGTPDADDVAASPYDVEFCATNSGGTTCDTAQFTVVAVPGDTLTVSPSQGTSASPVDCDTFESGGRVDPGDILQIAGGVRSNLVIRDCQGTAASPITIRNDVTDTEPAILEKTAGGATNWLECTNCINVVLDGTGKYNSADAGTCGVDEDRNEGRTQCGIVLRTDGAATCAVAWIRFNGLSSNYTIKGVEIDGTGCTGAPGVGITANDGQIKSGYDGDGTYGNDAAENGGIWREDIIITQNYIHDTGDTAGEGMYIGPNGGQDELPLRRVEISYNLVENVGSDGIEVKYWLQGPNYIHHNHVYSTGNGTPAETGQHKGIGSIDGGEVEIYANYVEAAGSSGISCSISEAVVDGASVEPDIGPYYCLVYNNIVVDAGVVSGGKGVTFLRNTSTTGGTRAQISPARAYHNTVVSASDGCVNFAASLTGTQSSSANICAGTTTQQNVSGVSDTTSLKGTVVSIGFVDAGSDDYHITTSSSACNSTGSMGLTTDFDGDSRPNGAFFDKGADEACP